VPGKMLMHRVDLHFIESVMKAQDLAQLQVRERNPGTNPGTIGDPGSTPSRLLGDAVTGLAAQREPLGLADNERFFNTAAGMAARAGRDGLDRIDHVVASSRGGSAIAVQGDLQDPTQRRSMVGLDEAGQTPARQSAMSLREQDAQRQGQAQEPVERQQRPALAH
ncbi:MAG: XVIPCD domain-containing protein, partial [Pseudoxanthomonas sp.]